MRTNHKVLFIINPKSGKKNKRNIPDIIKSNISKDVYYQIVFWEHKEQDINAIINKAVDENIDIITAVGGDGTVNKIAQAVQYTNIPLAIIPTGSGNGLARHLNIPLDIEKAVQLLSRGKIISIDACTINNKTFFCTSGVGFDAHIGNLFAKNNKRGFISYLKIILSEFIKYKPQKYSLTIDTNEINIKAFLVTFANASQYGNNGIIAPTANIQDGLIDVTIIKPFRFWHAISIGFRLLNKTIHHSRFVETYKAKHIILRRESQGLVHFDGEPDEMSNIIEVSIKPNSLKVCVLSDNSI